METNTVSTNTDPAANLISPEDLIAQLRAYRERIPDYGQLTTAGARQLRSVASLKTVFVTASINAVGASGSVQAALSSNPSDLMQQQADVARWAAVEDELRAMLKVVAAANLIRRHRLGVAALQSYAISRQLVRQPEHADLLPHVYEMKRLNRRQKKSDNPADPAPQPQPQPQPPASADSHPEPPQSPKE